MKRPSVSPVVVSICLTVVITLWAASNINWGKQHYKSIIKSDGKGYYAHLPAIFIYNDLNFHFFDSLDAGTYYNSNLYYDYRSVTGNDTVNKYYAGAAIPMMPFFLAGHGLSLASDQYPADGYSKYYQISINIAAIVYMAMALGVMGVLLRLYRIRKWVIALVLPVMVFGTNWFYYVLSEPAMSHSYSVFFIALLGLLAYRWNREDDNRTSDRYLWKFALVLGLVTAIRPLNGLAGVFLLLFAPGMKRFASKASEKFRKPVQLLLPLALFFVPIAFQLVIYKVQTGHWWVYSYGEEGFNFLRPHFIDILFSYRKGLFVYTPVLFIALWGYYFMRKQHRWESTSMLMFLAAITYLFSSWWNWYYGGSFSSRVYIDYFVLFAIPLAFMLNGLRKKTVKWSVISLLAVLTLFCQFQTYQYRYEVIHWDEMNREKYWDAFLNTDFIKKKQNPER